MSRSSKQRVTGYTPAEALRLVHWSFTGTPKMRPPWRIIAASRLGYTENLLPALGIRDADLRQWDHPQQAWREFRARIPSGRFTLWFLGGADDPQDPSGGMILMDSQVLDKAFTHMEALQSRVVRGRARS